MTFAAAITIAASALAHASAEFGDPVGEPLAVPRSEAEVDIDWNSRVALDADGDGFVAWIAEPDTNSTAIQLRRVSANGIDEIAAPAEPVVEPFVFRKVVIAVDADGDAVAAWALEDMATGVVEIRFRRFGADGTFDGDAVQVVASDPGFIVVNPSIAMDAAGNFVVGWDQYDTATFTETAYVRRFDKNGNPLGDVHQIGAESETSDIQVAMNASGEFVVAWDDDGHKLARRHAADGTAIGDVDFSIIDAWHDDCSIAIADDGTVASACIVFGDYVDSEGVVVDTLALRISRFTATGVAVGEPVDAVIVDEEASGYIDLHVPGVAFDTDGAVLVGWLSSSGTMDVYASRTGASSISTAGEVTTAMFSEASCTAEGDGHCWDAIALGFDADGDMLLLGAEGGWYEDSLEVFTQRFRGPEAADLAATLTLPAEAAPGNTVAATLTVENLHALGESGIAAYDGALGATHGIAVDFTLPTAFEIDAKTGEWACESADETTVRCTHPGILPAASERVLETSFVVPADAGEGEYAFAATVSGDRVDPEVNNNTSKATFTVASAGAPPDSGGDSSPPPATGGSGGGGGALGWLMIMPFMAGLRRRRDT